MKDGSDVTPLVEQVFYRQDPEHILEDTVGNVPATDWIKLH